MIQSFVKLEKGDPLVELAKAVLAGGPAGAPTQRKFTISDVHSLFPMGYSYLWTFRFVPDFLYYVGGRLDPWNMAGVNWTATLKDLWATTTEDLDGAGSPPTGPQSPISVIVSPLPPSFMTF